MTAVPVALLGQEKSQAPAAPPANPITASEKGLYSFVSNAVIGAAQKMPEENYSFKPTPDVRSFGQLVGHVADASYMFCSQALGEPNPVKDIEKNERLKDRSRGSGKVRGCVLQQGVRQYDRCQGQPDGKTLQLRHGEAHFVLTKYCAHG